MTLRNSRFRRLISYSTCFLLARRCQSAKLTVPPTPWESWRRPKAAAGCWTACLGNFTGAVRVTLRVPPGVPRASAGQSAAHFGRAAPVFQDRAVQGRERMLSSAKVAENWPSRRAGSATRKRERSGPGWACKARGMIEGWKDELRGLLRGR